MYPGQTFQKGARVYVLWTDGGSYPATVGAVSQGYVQVWWDAGGAPAWVPVSNVGAIPNATPPQQTPAYAAPVGPQTWAHQGWSAPQGAAQQAGMPQGAAMPQAGVQQGASMPQAQGASMPQAQGSNPQGIALGWAAPPTAQPQVPSAQPAPPAQAMPSAQPATSGQPTPSQASPPAPIHPVPAKPTATPGRLAAIPQGPPPRPMKSQVQGLPRGLVYEPTGSGPGNGKAFFFFFGFVTVTDSDMAMRMTDIEHLGDDVAALRAAGFRVVVDLHGDAEGLNAALAGKHPEAQGAEAVGVFWSSHGDDDGSLQDYEGYRIKPEAISEEATRKATVKLFVMSACYVGGAQERWQKALGKQAFIIGWGAPISNDRAVDFLTPDDESSKDFDDLLLRHLQVKRVAEDGALAEVKALAEQHEAKTSALLLSFDELVDGVQNRSKNLVKKQGKNAMFLVITPPSKDQPGKLRTQAVRMYAIGTSDVYIVVSSLIGPYSDALDLPRAIRMLDGMMGLRLTLSKFGADNTEFVLVEAIHRRRRLDPLTLARSIGSVGIMADRIEDMFFGSDER